MQKPETIEIMNQDSLFKEAAKHVVAAQAGSTSLLQRKLNLGYNRAAVIMTQLRTAGIVGEFNPEKSREVLIKTINELEPIFKRIKPVNIPPDHPKF